MLASGILLLMLVELAAYAALDVWLVSTHGWRVATAVALAVFIAVTWRAMLTLASYALAMRKRSRPPRALQVDTSTFMLRVLQEIVIDVAVYGLLQPFERLLMGREPISASSRTPVLLVHGFLCNRGVWWWMKRRLQRDGFRVYTINLEPLFADIDAHVAPLARRIEEIVAGTGAARVMIVGHSMGGLVARAYLGVHGASRIARIVTIGTPHHGSVLAPLGYGEAAFCMRPRGVWLERLSAGERSGFAAPTVSLFSYHDNLVAPQESSVLLGARNVPVAGIGHLALVASRRIYAMVRNELAAEPHNKRSTSSA